MKANVDQDTCIGCGLCPSTCPEVFTMADTGKAVAINSDIPDTCLSEAEEARDGCPVSAIDLN